MTLGTRAREGPRACRTYLPQLGMQDDSGSQRSRRKKNALAGQELPGQEVRLVMFSVANSPLARLPFLPVSRSSRINMILTAIWAAVRII